MRPASKGGDNDPTNLVTACQRCNASRGNRPIAQFARAVAEYLDHGVEPDEITRHVRACQRRVLPREEARELLSRRGSVARVLQTHDGGMRRKTAGHRPRSGDSASAGRRGTARHRSGGDVDYTTITLERDGARALRGMLALIGEGESGTGGTSGYACDWTRRVNVKIYRNERGGYAVSRRFTYIHHWTRWQEESDRYEAWTVSDPKSLLVSLEDEDGGLRSAEREAWDDACKRDPDLQPLECEEI